MSVAKKGMRRIVVDNRLYWWHTRFLADICSVLIVSDDRHFSVSYHIGDSHITIEGQQFSPQSVRGSWGGWLHVRSPLFATESATPLTVQNIIRWCHAPKKTVMIVDWQGQTERTVTIP